MKIILPFFLAFFLVVSAAQSQTRSISGVVTEINNAPIPGANIVVKGTSNGTTSGFDGNFTINNVGISDILVISYLGFKSKEVVVGDQLTIDVVLEEDTAQLDEVVVIGYGTSNKKELVSAVSQVKGEVIRNQPVSRLDQALQGRATGVEVVSNNGAPGNGATIRIRGNSSIQGNNNPLFVVDGFIVGTGFNLNNLNVNDIESIEILKDASALAIYGTRGASGVILITTKNGERLKEGSPSVTVNAYTALDQMANRIEILDGRDYVNYVNEANQFVPGPVVNFNGNSLALGITDPDLPLIFPNPNDVETTDWIDLVETSGIRRNLDVSVSGRSKSTNYYTSINYFDQEGIIRNSGIERLVFRGNLDSKISERFKMGTRLNVSFQRRENNKVNFNAIVSSVLPTRTIFDEDGNFTGTNPVSGSLQRNPEADIQLRENHDIITNIIANAYLEYEVLKDLKLKTTLGATLNYFKNNQYLPGALPERILNNNIGGFAQVSTNQTRDILNENTFTYKRDFGKHGINLVGGFSFQHISSEGTFASAEGFPNDVVQFNNLALGSDPETYQIRSGYNQRTLESYFGRLTYSYNKKYVLSLIGRYDGSSVFEPGNKYAFFPSIGAAWNIDEEPFMDNVNFVDRLKIRTGYGEIGEQGVPTYNSFDIFNSTFNYFNENLVPAVILASPGSNGLTWETTEAFDVGLEVGLFNNRVNFEAGYYNKVTRDLLLNVDLPGTAGLGRVLQNIGSVQNRGLEFGLNTINIDKGDFKWTSSLNISFNRSEVLDLGDEDFIPIVSTGNQGGNSAALIPGQPFPVFIGAQYLGTYQDPQQIIDDGREGVSFLGSPRFTDLDGNGVINNQDAYIIGSPEPDFFGGIRNTFSYKGIFLDVFFHGSYGGEIFNALTQTSFYGRGDQNLDPRVLNRWRQGVNEVSNVPRAGTSTSVFNPNSTVNVEDGSFLRLRTVTLSYDLPLKSIGLDHAFKSVNIYVSGNNLLLFSDFQLGDPEVNNFTAGSGFGSVSQGFATGQYPYATSISTGITVEF